MTGDASTDPVRDRKRLAELRSLDLLDTPQEETFDCFTRLAARFLDVPVALFTLVDDNRQFFKSQVGLPEPWASQRETPLSHSFCQHVVSSGEPFIIEDAREDPLVRNNGAIDDLGVVAYAGIPLTTPDGNTLGSFCAIDDRPHKWTEEEINVLQDLAAGLMTEVRLRTDLHHRRRAETLLSAEKRVLEAISTGRALPEVLDILSRGIEEQLDSGLCSILRLDPESATLHTGAAPHLPEEFTRAIDGIRVGEGQGVCGTAAFRNEPVIVSDVEGDPLLREFRDLVREHGIAAAWSYPIRGRDGCVLGTFAVYFRTSREPTPAEREVVERAAALASVAFERERSEAARREAQDRAVQMAERMRAVADAASGILPAQTVEELDGVLRTAATRVLPHDVLTFAVYQPDEGSFRFLATKDGVFSDPPATLPLASTPSERVVRERRSLLTLRSTDPAAAGAKVVGTGRRSESVIRTPILSGGRVLGVLSVESYTPDFYTREDVDVLEAFAAVAASAMQNIELVGAVRAREEHYRRLVTTAPLGVYAANHEGFCTEANPALASILGRSSGDLLGHHFAEFVAPEDLEAVQEIFQQRVAGERESAVAELRFVRPSGERRLVQAHSTVVREGDAVAGVHGLVRDITEERDRDQWTRFLAAAVEAMAESVSVLDAEGRLVYSNPAHRQMLGYPEGTLPRPYADFLPDEASQEQLREILAHVQDHGTWSGAVRRRHTSGRSIQAEAIVQSVHHAGVELFFGVSRDVTEERVREARLQLFSTALESLSEAVSVIDEEGRFVYSNTAHSRMLGYEPGRIPEGGVESFLPDEAAQAELRAILEHVRRYGTWRGQVRRQRTDGTIFPLEITLQKVEQEGRILLFTIGRDLTKELAQEQRLRRVERLASIGTLVSGVAHELNNPLHAIRNFAALLLLDEPVPERREDLQTIQRESDRMSKIVSDLSILARRSQESESARSPVDLNDVVRHVLRTREHALSTHNVEVRQDLAPTLPKVLGDRGELEQVLLNLVVNAEQAMEDQVGERLLILRTRASDQGISLHVVDSGPGIPAPQLASIFDPFWTTKAPGKGTGVGLSLVHEIVLEHQGEIHAESQLGRGAAFRIDLPRAPGEPEQIPLDEDTSAPSRSFRVLVVEDEPANRRVLVRILQRRGHEVDEAEEGGAALRLIEKGDYDVIVSDLRMRGMGGDELLSHLRERDAELARRFIILTGDVASAAVVQVLAQAEIPILGKPLDHKMLAAAVESVGESAGRRSTP